MLAKESAHDEKTRIEREIYSDELHLSEVLLNANRDAFNAAIAAGRIRIDDLGREYEKYMTDEKFMERTFKGIDAIFFDSLNISLLTKYHRLGRVTGSKSIRDILHDIFAPHRKANRLVFFLLEDYGSEATDEMRQYIADCEFLADSVIQLSEKHRQDYRTWSLKIKKKHFSTQTYGEHIYKICGPNHALSNIYHDKSGIVVFPSIHSYLSGAREAFDSYGTDKYVGTGITHLDAVFSGDRTPRDKAGMSMPPDATVVIRGTKGSHKLPFGINILLGGMWTPQPSKGRPAERDPKDVLIILLDEESNINLAKTAIAHKTELLTDMVLPENVASLDNANWLRAPSEQCTNKKDCHWKELCGTHINSGKKVFFRRTCFNAKSPSGHQDCRKAVIAGFRPGCITPEEFLTIVKKLIRPYPEKPTVFSRVLFVSTAHLRMRFPLLDSEKLFLPALIDVFKSERILSIIIDIEGEGSDKKLSYGLSSLADYLITLRPLASTERHEFLPYTRKSTSEALDLIRQLRQEYGSSREGFAWSEVDVENVRGKEYSKSSHAVTVLGCSQGDWRHGLHLVNLERRHNKQRLHDRMTVQGVELVNNTGETLPVTCVNLSASGMQIKHDDALLLSGIRNVRFRKGTIQGGPISLHTRWTRKTGNEYETGYELVDGTLSPLCDYGSTEAN